MSALKSTVLSLILVFLLLEVPNQDILGQNTALVWSDEFDYTGLPTSEKWTFEEGGHGWGNNEIQYYTKNRTQNARVEGGNLIIEAIRENYGNREYTSARMISKFKGDWLYGRIEVRAKLPGGKGTWPAIWMLPTDWAYGNWPSSGEIDIMEHVGYDPTKVFGTAHTHDYNHTLGTQKGSSVSGTDFESAFHVYAIEWDESKIDFIVDDLKYYTFLNEGSWQKWPFDKRFHLLLNIAVGGSWGGAQGVDPSVFPQRMTVDYVRVYQSANLTVTGPIYLDPAQTGTYRATQYPGADYDWMVPQDAEIVSGQGTSVVNVMWGPSDGDIRVVIKTASDTLHTSVFVKTVSIPQGTTYWFGNLVDGNTDHYSINTTDGSSFLFTEDPVGVRISYTTVTPSTWPRFELTLDRPVNLKNHPWCVINIKTLNLSNSVSLRFDFADVYGTETNATPVFRPSPIIADGNYHLYQNNFTGRWLSSSPEFGNKVDSTRINKMIVYINGGLFGQANKSDSLWIESIKFQSGAATGIDPMEQAKVDCRIYPNPVSDRLIITAQESIKEVAIYSLAGQKVIQRSRVNSPSLVLSVTDIPPGIYLIRLQLGNDRVVVERMVHE